MILNEERKDVQTNVKNKSKEFTIKTTAKAFKILSSGLYSDKIKAIVRELSCNALDAHIMANSKIPFHVHLPNKLEPWFSVRDYGIGLSEKDVMNLYSTYFESTKTGSNDQIGALGLGSKSPFSYTDSFNITSIFDEMRRTYTAFIDEMGTPSIMKVHEQTIGEHIKQMKENLPEGDVLNTKKEKHNGIEIKFAVNVDDFDDFAKKAGQVFRVFKTKPEVSGNNRYKNYEQTLTTVLSGKNWAYNKTDFYTNDRAVAIQGNIEYPIDKNQLGNLSTEQEFIVNGKFYIDFKIGDLDISASRESLGYDESTVDNIKNELDKIYKSFHRMLNKKIQSASTLFDAYNLAVKVTNEVGLSYYESKGMKFKWTDKKFVIGEDFEYIFSEDSTKDDAGMFLKDGVRDDSLVITMLRRERHHSSNRVTSQGEYKANEFKEVKFSYCPNELTSSIFLVVDEDDITDYKLNRKSRQFARTHVGKTILFMNKMSLPFFNAMGNPGYEVTSNIELIKTQRGSNGAPIFPDNYFHLSNTTVNRYSNGNCSYSELEDKCDGDITGHYYISRVRDKYYDGQGLEVDKDHVYQMFHFLKECGMIDDKIQLFAIKNAEKNTKRWIELEWNEFVFAGKHMFIDYVDKNMNRFKEPLIAKKAFNKIDDQVGYRMRNIFDKEYKCMDDYPKDSAFVNMMKIYMKAKSKNRDLNEEISEANNIVNIGKKMGIDIEKSFDVNMNVFDMKAMYPMIEFISDWDLHDDENCVKLKAYIILVDKSK